MEDTVILFIKLLSIGLVTLSPLFLKLIFRPSRYGVKPITDYKTLESFGWGQINKNYWEKGKYRLEKTFKSFDLIDLNNNIIHCNPFPAFNEQFEEMNHIIELLDNGDSTPFNACMLPELEEEEDDEWNGTGVYTLELGNKLIEWNGDILQISKGGDLRFRYKNPPAVLIQFKLSELNMKIDLAVAA